MERYNPWWSKEEDLTYLEWEKSEIKWIPEIVESISMEPFSLNFIYGPRQVGKTTAVKILIHRLLESADSKAVFYYSCDELTDHRELGEVLDTYLSSRDAWGIRNSFIFLDEVTFVKEWWRAIKSRIDSGRFSGDVITITGSASMELSKQKELFPGRRGNGADYLMMPLSFSRYSEILSNIKPAAGDLEEIEKNVEANRIYSETLKRLLGNYMETGGFPRAIKDIVAYGKVSTETKKTYLDWMRGDWMKAGKSEKYMKEVISYIMKARGTPISWNGIASETGINSPHTARSYVEVLEGTFSALVLYMLSQDFRVLYRKNKKVHFTDPLIYRIFADYTGNELSEDWLVEGVSASLLSRKCPVFYWRNSTEVDIVCRQGKKQIGFEITRGIKRWKKPRHIEKAHLLDKENMYLYLASI
jgi:predicted AAA+ superfamily ATPase